MNISSPPPQESPPHIHCSASQLESQTNLIPALRVPLQQSFEKQGFHAGAPAASFSLPSALGSGGPINPPTAAAYAPAPFMHILAPHQQPHSQILHHHLQQDGQVADIVVSLHLLVQVALTPVVQANKKDTWLAFLFVVRLTFNQFLIIFSLSYACLSVYIDILMGFIGTAATPLLIVLCSWIISVCV